MKILVAAGALATLLCALGQLLDMAATSRFEGSTISKDHMDKYSDALFAYLDDHGGFFPDVAVVTQLSDKLTANSGWRIAFNEALLCQPEKQLASSVIVAVGVRDSMGPVISEQSMRGYSLDPLVRVLKADGLVYTVSSKVVADGLRLYRGRLSSDSD